MKYNGTSWATVGTAGFSADTAYTTSIAIDGSGTPYVAYVDAGDSDRATVMKYNGTSWVTVGTAGFSAGKANYTSIAIDGSGIPYVAYEDAGNSNKATVMKYNGTSWDTVGTAGFSAAAALNTSVAIAPNGIPVVAYEDDGNYDEATVMKYSATQDASLPVQATDFVANSGVNSVTLSWKTQSEVDNAGFNILREKAGTGSFKLISSYTSDDSLRGLGTNSTGRSYDFTDNQVVSGATYRYKIQSVSTNGGTTKDLSTLSVTVDVPKTYALYQNYPNPFNPSTAISYELSAASRVTLKVYDVLGREVATLVDGQQNAGVYKVSFNASRYASGVYFYRLAAIGNDGRRFVSIKEAVLLK